jgi:putative ABC transport system substrate-binding protein
MNRREFITLLGGAAAWPVAARAQQSAKVARIGFLSLGPASAWSNRVEALRAGLRDLGWIDGKNVVIEFRWADNVSQLPQLAAGLVRIRRCHFRTIVHHGEPARQETKPFRFVFSNHARKVRSIEGIPTISALTGTSLIRMDAHAPAHARRRDREPAGWRRCTVDYVR